MAKHEVAVRSRIFLLTAIFGSVLSPSLAIAQSITLDGTLGTNAPIPTRSNANFSTIYDINQNLGQTVGTNLFHSFATFNLTNQEAAFFRSATDIRNIISRVTGGTTSAIDGLIQTQSTNVNLFLINPNGITFGPNAQLNIGGVNRGSFVATTLDAIVFPNGGQFSATNPSGSSSLLTLVGDPSGFLASQRTIAPITLITSNLQVPNGQSLVLVGGNVNITGGRLDAWGGQVEIAAIADSVTIQIGTNNNLTVPNGIRQADVTFANRAFVDVTSNTGGSISVTARNIHILDESILSAGIYFGLGTSASQAGDLTLRATDTVTISGTSASHFCDE